MDRIAALDGLPGEAANTPVRGTPALERWDLVGGGLWIRLAAAPTAAVELRAPEGTVLRAAAPHAQTGRTPFEIVVAGCRLCNQGSRGRIGDASWQISWLPAPRGHEHGPPAARLGLRLAVANPLVLARGRVEIAGRTIALDYEPALQLHLALPRPAALLWAGAAAFDGRPGMVFSLLGLRPFARGPELADVLVRVDGEHIRLAAVVARTASGLRIRALSPTAQLNADLTGEPGRATGDLHLELRRRTWIGRYRPAGSFVCRGRAAWELTAATT